MVGAVLFTSLLIDEVEERKLHGRSAGILHVEAFQAGSLKSTILRGLCKVNIYDVRTENLHADLHFAWNWLRS